MNSAAPIRICAAAFWASAQAGLFFVVINSGSGNIAPTNYLWKRAKVLGCSAGKHPAKDMLNQIPKLPAKISALLKLRRELRTSRNLEGKRKKK